VGQITIRDTDLPAAINAGQWQNWSSPPFPWQDARFYEYQNTGPGSAAAADVPQLTPAQAAGYTVAGYLGGWRPREGSWAARAPAKSGEPVRQRADDNSVVSIEPVS
jgi:hypothetical protein